MRVMGACRIAVSALAVVAACRSPARVRLVDATPGPCGQASGVTNLEVIAYTPGGEQTQAIPPGGAVTIDDFPADTEQLGVEVLGGDGVIALAGKTAPLDFAALVDGSSLPVFVAPPGGACSVGPLLEPRAQPLVALAGDGVLVVGGTTTSGPSNTAERYDFETAAFETVTVPNALVDPINGLIGGVLTPLPDGSVVLTGTSHDAFTIYDPTKHQFGEVLVFESRAFHAAIAVDDTHLLIAGGCEGVSAGACNGFPLPSSEIYDISDLANLTSVPGPALSQGTSWIDAQLYDTGSGYVLAGGTGTFGVADRLVLGDAMATGVTGLRGGFAALDGGAMLSADAGGTAVLAPTGTAPVAVAGAPDGSDTLLALEDGRVLGIGSDRELYDPTTEAWTQVAPAGDDPGPLAGATALRLPDGSVLVLGASPPSASAWVVRPSLVGSSSGSVVVLPDDGSGGVMTAVDPATLALDGYVLTADATDLDARALVGGTRMATGSLAVTATVGSGGGVALIARQLAPGDALVARLVPGSAAEIDDLASGAQLCTGSTVMPFVANAPVQLELEVDGGVATMSRDSVTQVSCGVADGARGAWGVAPLGGTIGVQTATVTR
jgi:hypothetical protein